ncbi:hypothetical protein EDD11_009731 [Mortierella claussenii]|nr:hypothetical protein EDD11_009731 [Mortierella claussenii]
MSTAKPGLTVPFIPPDSASKPARSRKQRNTSNNSNSSNNNSQPRKLEKSPSFNSNLHNGLNTLTTGTTSTPADSASINSKGNSSNSNNKVGSIAVSVSENGSKSSATVASKTPGERSRGYLSNRSAAARLDQDSSLSSRRDINSGSNSGRPTGASGRLFDPKRDPVPVAPPSSASQQQQQQQQPQHQSYARTGSADTRNLNPSSRKRVGHTNQQQQQQQQNHRLYDPNNPQPQSVRYDNASASSASLSSAAQNSTATTTAASSQLPLKQSSTASTSVSTALSPMDGLVKLTKEIQQLEKKVMEKPSRRTLESDDDTEGSSRQSGRLTWNRRMDNSKRLASKYLKLMQLDFKSSLKHDIDTRCWKLAIYPLIETFRAALRNSEHTSSSGSQELSESDEDHTESIRHYFAEFIGFAQEFYETLKSTLQKLEAKHATSNGGLAQKAYIPRWHRCIGIMGDLARYRWLHNLEDKTSSGLDWLVVARRFYREAIDLGPGNGKMYNQLALLTGGRGLESLYYYSKSLTVRSSFINARDTLTSFFASESIRNLQNLSLKQNAKARQAALASATLKDCETSFLLLHAMLFEKINLDNFEKRLRNFSKQLKALHTSPTSLISNAGNAMSIQQPLQPERWDGFYFMLAVINIAAVYEFNWSASVIAKSNTAFGDLADHLATVPTLPYSSKLLLSTMEQSMQRYLTSVGDSQKMFRSSVEEQQGWLVYCHVVLVWMAGRPFGSGDSMTANWLMMADHLTLPTFWTTLTTFMNHHWNRMSPFEQSDMLSAISEEMSDNAATQPGQESAQAKTFYQVSLPPLGQEWELRGLAWLPTARFGSHMFKGSQPVLDEKELKDDILWKQESLKLDHLTKRIVELSLIAAMHMEIVEFDFCENAFKISDAYASQAEEATAIATAHVNTRSAGVNGVNTEEYSTDDNLMSSSHTSISQDSGVEDDEAALFSSDNMDYSTAEIMELKSKRDQLKSLLSESNANGRQSVSLGSLQRDYRTRQSSPSYGSSGQGKKPKNGSRDGGRGYVDRRNPSSSASQLRSQRGTTVTENSTLVIDTNCLVADWTVIQRLVSADRWTVVIPLAVITELDGLKNNPAPLGPAAAGALNYLEGCLAMRPKPRRLKIQTSRGNYMNDLSFRVESFNFEKQQQHSSHHRKTASGSGNAVYHDGRDDEEYDGDEEIMRNHNVDDFILGLCLWHQENGLSSSSAGSGSAYGSPFSSPSASPSIGDSYGRSNGGSQNIYLVTDDRNLRVKARARSVEVLGKEDLAWMTMNHAG